MCAARIREVKKPGPELENRINVVKIKLFDMVVKSVDGGGILGFRADLTGFPAKRP